MRHDYAISPILTTLYAQYPILLHVEVTYVQSPYNLPYDTILYYDYAHGILCSRQRCNMYKHDIMHVTT